MSSAHAQGPPGKPEPPRGGIPPSLPLDFGSPPVRSGCVDTAGAQQCAKYMGACDDTKPETRERLQKFCAKTCNLDNNAVCDVARKNRAICKEELLGSILTDKCPCACGSR